MDRFCRLTLCLLAILLLPGLTFGQGSNATLSSRGFQDTTDYATVRFERVLTATAIEQRLQLDGRLDEPVWARAEVATNFIQWQPDTGAPATEQTVVRILYDQNNLYIGAICYDSQPDRMVAKNLEEDFSPRDTDLFGILLDTLRDGKSGFVFATNPAGARHDAQVASDEPNADWDGVWDVRVAVNKESWTAEFAIPFKTLRFSRDSVQEWGMNFSRRVRRRNEESLWTPIPRRYRWLRSSMAGTLRGVEGARPGSNFKLKPFVTTEMTQNPAAGLPNRDGGFDGGLDVKYGVTQSLTLDLTYRTDFSQVEVDQQQINLTRFNLFFPEKREFFLENGGLFTIAGSNGRRPPVGSAGGGPQGRGSGSGGGTGSGRPPSGSNSNLLPFFSRRIGLGETGTPIPIVGGARLSGKASDYDLGFLAMRSASDADMDVPAQNFIVGRVARNFRANTWVGGLVTHRNSTIPGDFNRVYGIDTSLRFFEKLEITSYFLGSTTPGRSGQNTARLLDVGWLENDLTLTAQYEDVESNFNPDMGFVRRHDIEHFAGDIVWLPRVANNRIVRNFAFVSEADYYANNRGQVETRQQKVIAGIDFQDGSNLGMTIQPTFERLYEPFSLRGIEVGAGDYSYRRYGAFYSSDRSRAFGGGVNMEVGDFWDGRNRTVGGNLEFRPNAHLSVSINYDRSAVTLRDLHFTTTLVASRIGWAFSNRAFLNSFLQYNADLRQLSANTRFRWIHRPLSDVFLVFNERRDTVTGELVDRAVILKLTNLFDF